MGSLKLRVRNLTKNTILADRADIADTSATRNKGLLKHTGLAEGEGLWIVPCEGVHSFFMKFAIDVVFINKKRVVTKSAAQYGQEPHCFEHSRALDH